MAENNSDDSYHYYWVRVGLNASPIIIIDRDLLLEHVHVLGNSGSGKSKDVK